MSKRDDNKEKTPERSPLNELKQLAWMYHVVGNYAKADEIMGVVRELEAKRAEPEERRRDAA
jgi:hypothetical protein